MSTNFKPNEVLLLLGAGASYDAGIPVSAGMIDCVEKLLEDPWKEYRDLYNCIRSSITYSRGIHGIFDGGYYNIESLVYTLDELVRWDKHVLYPFIGSWSPKLLEVTKGDFEKIRRFRNLIVRQLRDEWVQLRYESTADYYAGLFEFKKQYNYPLRIFSLNYDLCLEKACKNASIQRGFGEDRLWEWTQFDESDGSYCDIYLYKLHGSIDWTRRDDERLTYVDGVTHIDPDKLAIIFGVTYKLQYLDPFLFFAYEFRRWTLDEDSRIIIVIGYGFGDDHINGILRQSLIAKSGRRLLAVSPKKTTELPDAQVKKIEKDHVDWIRKCIGLKQQITDINIKTDQIVWINCGAKEFMEKRLTISELSTYFPSEIEPFSELAEVTSESGLDGSHSTDQHPQNGKPSRRRGKQPKNL